MANDRSPTTSSFGSNGPGQAVGAQAKPVRHFHQTDLSRRWNVSPRTLERWRWQGKGPRYLKVGGRILYRLEDIQAFEAESTRQPGVDKGI